MSTHLLAIDTCTRRASIALRDAHMLHAEITWECERQETAHVAERVQHMLRTSHVDAAQIGAVGVAIGPGSYTGVRCGLAIAKGMAVALNIPLIGVNAFDVVAYAQPAIKQSLMVVVEVGRSRVATCPYDLVGARMLSGEWRIRTWQELRDDIYEPTWVCGDLRGDLIDMLATNANAHIAPATLNVRRAGYLAEIAWGRWTKGEVDDALTLSALYPAEPT
jgi:tRNA threonylcarbamoyladenosine biosynthesis protein TsaB